MDTPDISLEVSDAANTLLAGQPRIKVLEAGCGSASHVRFAASTHTVGIDISPAQLERNNVVQERIVGDIQVYPLPKEEFDAVVCWMVLEHLPRPKEALRNIFASVKPGGVVILAVPYLLSIKGIATKITPFWFHNFFYWFMKYKSRPFRTYLRMAILPTRMVRLAQADGFTTVFWRIFEGTVTTRLRTRFRSIDLAFSALDFFVKVVSFGKLHSLSLDNCFLILKKEGGKLPA